MSLSYLLSRNIACKIIFRFLYVLNHYLLRHHNRWLFCWLSLPFNQERNLKRPPIHSLIVIWPLSPKMKCQNSFQWNLSTYFTLIQWLKTKQIMHISHRYITHFLQNCNVITMGKSKKDIIWCAWVEDNICCFEKWLHHICAFGTKVNYRTSMSLRFLRVGSWWWPHNGIALTLDILLFTVHKFQEIHFFFILFLIISIKYPSFLFSSRCYIYHIARQLRK